jgi:hypothetical protein
MVEGLCPALLHSVDGSGRGRIVELGDARNDRDQGLAAAFLEGDDVAILEPRPKVRVMTTCLPTCWSAAAVLAVMSRLLRTHLISEVAFI